MTNTKTPGATYAAVYDWMKDNSDDIHHAIRKAAEEAAYEWMKHNTDAVADAVGAAYGKWLSEHGVDAMSAALIASKDEKKRRKKLRKAVQSNGMYSNIVHAILMYGNEHGEAPTVAELAAVVGLPEWGCENTILDMASYVRLSTANSTTPRAYLTHGTYYANLTAVENGHPVATYAWLSWPTVGPAPAPAAEAVSAPIRRTRPRPSEKLENPADLDG